MPYPILPSLPLSCLAFSQVPYPAFFFVTLPYLLFSYHRLPCLLFSYLALPSLNLPYPTLPFLLLPCLLVWLVSVGPCSLEYSRMKIPDHYWTDPSADELVQRHRIHSNSSYRVLPAAGGTGGGGSPKRPGLQVRSCPTL